MNIPNNLFRCSPKSEEDRSIMKPTYLAFLASLGVTFLIFIATHSHAATFVDREIEIYYLLSAVCSEVYSEAWATKYMNCGSCCEVGQYSYVSQRTCNFIFFRQIRFHVDVPKRLLAHGFGFQTWNRVLFFYTNS